SKDLSRVGSNNFTLSIRSINWQTSSLKLLAEKELNFCINKLGMQSFMPETLKQLADEVDE
ncbi:hypothetical protein Tco_0486256, partial [Tanacetum coccineum]